MHLLKVSKKSPKWLMLLILTLISGQTWAFYQAYDMAGEMDTMTVNTSHTEMHSNTNMPQHHNMNAMDMDDQAMNSPTTMDCCQVSYDCHCPASACSVINVLYINQDITFSFAPVSNRAFVQKNLYINKSYSPPYRPPIA